MDDTYRKAITEMENQGIQDEYVLGWQGGYLGHPEREEKVCSFDIELIKRLFNL